MPAKQTPYMVACGQRLTETRQALGFKTKREFANELDFLEDRYGSWENGKNMVQPECVLQLKERWGVTFDWIYFGDPTGLPVRVYNKIQAQKLAAAE